MLLPKVIKAPFQQKTGTLIPNNHFESYILPANRTGLLCFNKHSSFPDSAKFIVLFP